jgi:hypothetical protein
MLDFVPAPTRCINPLSCEVLLALDIFFVKPCPARGRKRPSAVGRPATARADRPSPQPAPMRCKPNRPARLRAQIAPPGWPGHPGIRSCRGGPVGVRQGLRYRLIAPPGSISPWLSAARSQRIGPIGRAGEGSRATERGQGAAGWHPAGCRPGCCRGCGQGCRGESGLPMGDCAGALHV